MEDEMLRFFESTTIMYVPGDMARIQESLQRRSDDFLHPQFTALEDVHDFVAQFRPGNCPAVTLDMCLIEVWYSPLGYTITLTNRDRVRQSIARVESEFRRLPHAEYEAAVVHVSVNNYPPTIWSPTVSAFKPGDRIFITKVAELKACGHKIVGYTNANQVMNNF